MNVKRVYIKRPMPWNKTKLPFQAIPIPIKASPLGGDLRVGSAFLLIYSKKACARARVCVDKNVRSNSLANRAG